MTRVANDLSENFAEEYGGVALPCDTTGKKL